MARPVRPGPVEERDLVVPAAGDAAWLDEMFERVEEVLGVDTISLLLVDPSGQHLVAHATHGLEEEVRQGFRLNIGSGFSGRIAQTGRAERVESIDSSTVANSLVIRKGVRSMMGAPLIAAGRTIGVLHVGTFVQRAFTDVDIGFLQLAADRMASDLVAEQERDRRVGGDDPAPVAAPGPPAGDRGVGAGRTLRSRRSRRPRRRLVRRVPAALGTHRRGDRRRGRATGCEPQW